MSGNMVGGDLFAGLSMAPSSSPQRSSSIKTQSTATSTTTAATVSTQQPPPSPSAASGSEHPFGQQNGPVPPMSSAPQRTVSDPGSTLAGGSLPPPSEPPARVTSAPVTDKLLGILLESPGSPQPAPAPASSAATGAPLVAPSAPVSAPTPPQTHLQQRQQHHQAEMPTAQTTALEKEGTVPAIAEFTPARRSSQRKRQPKATNPATTAATMAVSPTSEPFPSPATPTQPLASTTNKSETLVDREGKAIRDEMLSSAFSMDASSKEFSMSASVTPTSAKNATNSNGDSRPSASNVSAAAVSGVGSIFATVSSAADVGSSSGNSSLTPKPATGTEGATRRKQGIAPTIPRGVGIVHKDTPIPNSDVALRLFRRFAIKTRPMVPESHGGTQKLSFMTFIFGNPTEHDRKFDAYRDLMALIVDGDNAYDTYDDSKIALPSTPGAVGSTPTKDGTTSIGAKSPGEEPVLDQSEDTKAKACNAIASFVHMMSIWGHASAHIAEAEKGTQQTFCDILALGLDTATLLVTYGCLDGVMIGRGGNAHGEKGPSPTTATGSERNGQYHKAVDVLAESVFASDLSQERNELSAMKFLLSTGCRVGSDGHAMLRGSHLLQTIRVLYHVYLTTLSNANKTTARASLQQLVTSVFIRMISATDVDGITVEDNPPLAVTMTPPRRERRRRSSTEDDQTFPTDNHRDAFLVLRSLCKLSMRSPPSNMHSHVGLHSSGSNIAWDASRDFTPMKGGKGMGGSGVGAGDDNMNPGEPKEQPHHLYTQAIHPALESKILALDLLLYVLQNTNMKGSFLLHCGPQFHYAIRNYLCVSLLKNCTSDDTRVVNLSLRVFVPIIRNFRSLLKTEIEAFVTNVFFVILDSKNSPIEHKSLVVTLFEEICSDPTTLAEIFLNYDCDLSAVDLFHRIVNTLSKMARSLEVEDLDASSSTISLVAGVGAARMEKQRSDHRELRLGAMRALRQVLASLHASIVEPMRPTPAPEEGDEGAGFGGKSASQPPAVRSSASGNDVSGSAPQGEPLEHHPASNGGGDAGEQKKTLVQIYDSKKKRREEESEVTLRFNQKPSAGIAYAAKCGHLDGSDPTDVARYLLESKDRLDKTMIGEYLGREPDYQNGFSLKVLHEYVNMMDFLGLMFDDAIRFYLSGFRLPGEAQKIDRIMEKFAERFTAQNPDVFPSADVAFILAFSIIMLNTDLHNPAIKEERRMTKEGFIRNNRGICDGQDLPHELLMSIFDRIKANPISLKEDDEARERAGDANPPTAAVATLPSALSPAVFFSSHYDEMERTKENNFRNERDQIVRTTESLLRRRRHSVVVEGKPSKKNRSSAGNHRSSQVRYVRTEDSGLRDEYVSPMFEVTWGPALAAFSTAMESANGTVGALLSIATDEELELAAANAAETIEVCLTGFRFAICTAGLCGNQVARDAFMLALARFSQLGTGILLEPRHVRCIQTLLALAKSDGELLGSSWEHVFKSLSEINRFHQLFQLMARNDRAVAQAAERRKRRLQERERRQKERAERRAAREASDSIEDSSTHSLGAETDVSYESDLFSDSDDFDFNDEMDKKEIDEANARSVYEAVSEGLIEAIYERSSSLSTTAVKEFILQLCRVSRMEISHYGGHVGSNANQVDLTQVHYRQHHTLLNSSPSKEGDGFHHHQPNIYNLQKLVEVTHYNMESRPRLVFADLWTTVAAHLTSTALHSNSAVAMYAVDSFRQLSIQYLQREELGVFEFQRRFLKPLETVMERSQLVTTKELLLKCVERLILMFGSSDGEGNKGSGMLRSGWRPVLTVLGLAGRDADETIASLGFAMLTAQLKQCLSSEKSDRDEEKLSPGVLLAERFVDLVDAMLIYVGGPHESMSLKSIDNLVVLSNFLADESFALPLVKKRQSIRDPEGNVEGGELGKNQELELWWPILLGISKSIGDPRKKVRQKSLEVLMQSVGTHFFPSTQDGAPSDEEGKARSIQRLQLVFRGIFNPVLEFAEVDGQDAKPPQLPDDFERFITAQKAVDPNKSSLKSKSCWLDNTYDQFMDGCISLCLKSVDVFGDDTLIEEIFAMLNSCLLSDSGALAVRGLRRLEQFVTSDLKSDYVTDDTWATVSHMLRRCLSLRNLPRSNSSASLNGSGGPSKKRGSESSGDSSKNPALEEKEAIREFVAEDNILANRRYIGSNVISVMNAFLSGERFTKTLSLRWRLFLVSGLGRAMRDWETAASILANYGGKNKPRGNNPPHYIETTYYGRRHMNRFLLQVASMKEVTEVAAEGSRQAAAQSLIKDQTKFLFTAFLEKEAIVSKKDGSKKATSLDANLFNRLTLLVKDMLAGYDKLPDEHLALMSWLNPVLSSSIHTGNESIRIAIQRLVKRLH